MTRPDARFRGARDDEASGRAWPPAALAAAGFILAGYLAFTKWSRGTALFCAAGGGCDAVQASRYAVFLGLPTAAWGAALYATIGTLALSGLPARRWLHAFLLAVAGAAFSLYLTGLELFVIRALCGYCLASTVIALGLLAALVVQRPRVSGSRSPVRARRLVVLGSATAVLTLVIGAGIFATPSPREAAAYQEALARHLRESGAVMYGAYW